MKIEELEILTFILRRKKRLELLSYVAVFNLSLFFIFLSFYVNPITRIIMLGIGIFMLNASLILIIKWFFKNDIREHPLVELILERRNDVVWVYWHRTENMPFGVRVFTINNILIHLNDSSLLKISIQQDEVEKMLTFFKGCFSRASFGYSKDREQLYNIDPELVSKS